MSVQIIESNGKAVFAVIPIAEYRRLAALAEDRADIKEARALSAALESGEEESFPADFVARLTAGEEHPLRVWRKYRGQTLASLGASCGVSRSALSQIENGKSRASTALLKKLASALACDMEDLGA